MLYGDTFITDLKTHLQGCRDGLQTVLDNMYQYPDAPNAATGGRASWDATLSTFEADHATACERVGTLLDQFAGEPMYRDVEASMTEHGINGWADYFDGADGLRTLGTDLSAQCPAQHGGTLDCVDTAQTLETTTVPRALHLLKLLDRLECTPHYGWGRCLQMDTPRMTIMGSAATTPSGMRAVKHVYTDMTQRLQPNRSREVFDGYVAYLTNGEAWSDLQHYAPIGTMMTGNNGNQGDELRGGAGGNYLWITEQMICKTGVATRNQAHAEGRRTQRDDTYRSLDQVVHEFGHTIDIKYNLRGRIMQEYAGGWNPVEQFPWNIQYWFGTPSGMLAPNEDTFMNDLFASRTTYSCATYNPETVFVGVEDEAAIQDLPTTTTLGASYPNPFSTQTTIPFSLAAPGTVTLAVYDLLGREVSVVASGTFPAGTFEAVWDASAVASGVYVYALRTEAGTFTKQLLLVR